MSLRPVLFFFDSERKMYLISNAKEVRKVMRKLQAVYN